MSQAYSIQFEGYQKQTLERLRVIEQLLDINRERSDAEERYALFMEQLSNKINPQGGDLDDLLSSVKIDLHQRSQYSRQFTSSFKNDNDLAKQHLQSMNNSLKAVCQEVMKFDKETKFNSDKVERAKEKYNKSLREYEESAINLQAQFWNKEGTTDVRARLQKRVQAAVQMKFESEAQLKSSVATFNGTVDQLQRALNNAVQRMQISYDELFGSVKDIVMKTLVYDISRLRNLQYDSEQFFKEIEKFEDPGKLQNNPNGIYQLNGSRENLSKHQLNLNTSFLKPIADQIASQKSSKSYSGFEELFSDQEFISQLKSLTSHHIAETHGKAQQVLNQPLEEFISMYQPKSDQLKNILGFIDAVINFTTEQPCDTWKSLTIDYHIKDFKDTIQNLVYQECLVIVLECFRIAGQFQFTQQSFDNLVLLSQLALETTKDLNFIKRSILMFCTLFKMEENQKVFLQDALINLSVWKSLDLWDGLLFVSIEEEIDKSNNQSKDQLFKDKNVIFNNILTLTLNMMNFKLSKPDIKAMVQRNGKIYSLFEIQIQELLSFVESDGKLDVNKNVNSTQVLTSLYREQRSTIITPSQPPSQIQTQQQTQTVGPKRVLNFDRKPTMLQAPTQQQQQQQQVLQSPQTPVQPSPSIEGFDKQEEEPEKKQKAGFLKKLF